MNEIIDQRISKFVEKVEDHLVSLDKKLNELIANYPCVVCGSFDRYMNGTCHQYGDSFSQYGIACKSCGNTQWIMDYIK